jgi:HAD superfamily hydrolase (TIGR01484 family)
MHHFNGELELPPTHLVTDLDGTFLPLPDHPEHQSALQTFHDIRARQDMGLVFCTGRHFESALSALQEEHLPAPDWIICDVGTSVYQRTASGFTPFADYQDHLTERVNHQHRSDIETLLNSVAHLSLQVEAHQGPFKISYECETSRLEGIVAEVAALLKESGSSYDVHGSIDPFLDCGLVDILPVGVAKAYAVIWLATHADFTPDEVIYAGDSGNDLTALSAGFRAILVANASPGLEDQVRTALGPRRAEQRLYCATASATAGVLEGCSHFGLIR